MSEAFLAAAAIFAIGTWPFWIMALVVCLVMIVFIESDWSGWATITFLWIGAFLYFTGNLHPGWILEHPFLGVAYFFGYFAIGTTWALYRWWRFVVRIADKYIDKKRRFLQNQGLSGEVIPANLWNTWIHSLDIFNQRGPDVWQVYLAGYKLKINSTGIVPPDPAEHKSSIYMWILFWPWSMVGYILDEPVRRLLRWIFRRIRTRLEKISAYAFRGINTDNVPPSEPDEKKPSPPSARRKATASRDLADEGGLEEIKEII